jgi:hypothetical protein
MPCAPTAVSPLALEERATLGAAERADLEAIVAAQRTLEDVVRWGLAMQPPVLVTDVVVQDEYTHDVVLTLRADRHLVYDST